MFSRIYQSARALFTDTPQNEKIQPAQVVEPLRHETMVTTRKRLSQEAVGEEIDDENSINVYVPSSSKSRQKRTKQEDVVVLSDDDDATSTPTSTRKRKRLPVRAKDVESPGLSKTRPVVEIPTKKISPEPDHGKDLTIENEEVVSEDQDEERESKAVESLKNSKHHRFESEQVDDEFFSTAREAAVEENATSKTPADAPTIEDSEDSEDDAPEAVGIQEAAMSVKLKDRDAAKAVKDQLSASRKKRKERDDALKKQAETSKKRKLEIDVTSETKLVKSSVKEEKKTLLPKPDLNLNEDESHAIAGEGGIRNDTLLGISLLSKHSLPDLLPAEYLEDTEPQNLMLSEEIPRKKAKKTKFQQTEEKEPKDRRIGTTTYRVTKASSANLAPKSSSQARNTKESWLQGRSGKSVSTNRKSFTKGFFKK